jgi:hypothetical protein
MTEEWVENLKKTLEIREGGELASEKKRQEMKGDNKREMEGGR